MQLKYSAVLLALVALASAPATVSAGIVYSGDDGIVNGKAASVEFTLSGNTLTVQLSNLSNDTDVQNAEVLQAVLFSSLGTGVTLTPVSAALAGGSTIVNGAIPVGNTLGDGWAYGTSGLGGHPAFSISSTGFTSTLSNGNFGSNGDNLNGADYGLVGPGRVTGPNAMQGPQVKNSIIFTLTVGGTGTASVENLTVEFQYGTGSGDATFIPGDREPPPAVPVPPSVVLVLTGVVSVGLARARFGRRGNKAVSA